MKLKTKKERHKEIKRKQKKVISKRKPLKEKSWIKIKNKLMLAHSYLNIAKIFTPQAQKFKKMKSRRKLTWNNRFQKVSGQRRKELKSFSQRKLRKMMKMKILKSNITERNNKIKNKKLFQQINFLINTMLLNILI